jgi:hypothetical protein
VVAAVELVIAELALLEVLVAAVQAVLAAAQPLGIMEQQTPAAVAVGLLTVRLAAPAAPVS